MLCCAKDCRNVRLHLSPVSSIDVRRKLPHPCKMICQLPPPASNSAPVDRPNVNSKPQLLAWLLCDAVHIDPGSGKHTILGVFSNIMAKRFPVVHPHMVWFLTLTDVAAGPHVMRISIGLD